MRTSFRTTSENAVHRGSGRTTQARCSVSSTVCSNAGRLPHFDPRCIGSCVIVARIIRCELLHQRVTESDLLTLGRRYAPPIEEFVRMGCQPEIEPHRLDDPDTRGYTLRTLAAGLWAYNFRTDFRSAIQTLIAAGGDTDTNCAVAGALLSSRLGYASLPEDWMYGLLRRHELTEKARQLTEIFP